jgi:hypothetical protein
VRFDPLERNQLEIYYKGQSQGTARLVDAVVNAQPSSVKHAGH